MNDRVSDMIRQTVIENEMFACGERIVVGVSGGADSMCLLHFLVSVKEEFHLEIIVAHINHNLRGEEAYRDQKVVEQFCQERNIRCEVLSADVHRLAQESGESCETCGRRIRYHFFEQLCGDSGKIATAHTLSDSVETVLFHMARGAGLQGLLGIPKIRNNIIRPLINITRVEVEQYCHNHAVAYVTDSTNLENDYNRNKIRNLVTPVMKEINPSFETAVKRLSETAQQYLLLVGELAEQIIHKSRIKQNNITMYQCCVLKGCHETVLKQAMIALLQEAGCHTYEEKHIFLMVKAVCENSGGVDLPQNFCAVVRQGMLRVYQKQKRQEMMLVFPKTNSEFIINQQKIIVKIMTKEEFDKNVSVHKLLLKNALDCDIIHSEIFIRTRRSADRFRQSNRGREKSVKKLFSEAKIPLERRNDIVLVADGNEVLWIDGFGVSAKAGVTSSTRNVAWISVDTVRN